jgi:AsmA protein
MKRILLVILAVFLLLAGIAAIGIKLYVTKERVLSWAIPPLEKALARKVTLRDVSVGFTSFDLEGLDIRQEGAKAPLAGVERARVSWRLMPLLSGRLEIKEVRLLSPVFNVARLEDGSLDIDDLLKGAPKKEETAAPKGEVKPSGSLEVSVGRVRVENGAFTFEDRSAKPARTHRVKNLDAEVDGFAPDRPLPLAISAEFPDFGDARLEFKGAANELRDGLSIAHARLTAAGQTVDVTGSVKLAPKTSFDLALTSETFDVDKLLKILPPSAPAKSPSPLPAQAPAAKMAASSEPPAKPPPEGVCTVAVKKLTVSGIALDDVKTRIVMSNGVVTLDPADAGLYGGTFSGKASGETEKAGPPFTAGLKLDKVRMDRLVPALAPTLGAKVTGLLRADATAVGAGKDLRRLKARARAHISEGSVAGHAMVKNLTHLLRMDKLDTLPYDSIDLELTAENGVADVTRLDLAGSKLGLTAQGTVGLIDKKLDMTATVTVAPELAKNLLGKGLALTGESDLVSLPLRITGTTDNPSYEFDQKKLGKMARQVVKKGLEALPKALESLFR